MDSEAPDFDCLAPDPISRSDEACTAVEFFVRHHALAQGDPAIRLWVVRNIAGGVHDRLDRDWPQPSREYADRMLDALAELYARFPATVDGVQFLDRRTLEDGLLACFARAKLWAMPEAERASFGVDAPAEWRAATGALVANLVLVTDLLERIQEVA